MQRNSASIILVTVLIANMITVRGSYCQESPGKPDFQAPLNIGLFLSGNFGEVRSNHFHSGLDFKTEGKIGQPVMATAEGFVSRIKVEPGGYGKAIYIKHPNGYTSVYGHLNEFEKRLSEYVIEQQYQRESFSVDLFPPAGKFAYRQGEVIGFSGNSGSSMGPHLHFEIRDSQTENPINPLVFPFKVRDDISPVIYEIRIYSQDGRKELKNPDKYTASGYGGNYNLAARQPILVHGSFGVGIETLDFLNGSPNKCGVFSIKLFIDGDLYFHSLIDEFSFAESRYINSFVDYRDYREKRNSLYKTFIEPNNHLSIYQFAKNKGIINFQDDEVHQILLEVEDVAGNMSSLVFTARRDTSLAFTQPEQLPLYNAFFHYAEQNTFEEENIKIEIPAKALYNNVYFTYETAPARAGTFSQIHKVHDPAIPLHNSYSLRIRPDSLPDRLKQYALIAQITGKWMSPLGGSWDGEYLRASTRSFGNFAIAVDTTAPVIRPRNFRTGRDLLTASQIQFTISDDFSGISKFRGEMDGEWILFEWDPKNSLLFHDLKHRPLKQDQAHMLKLQVFDARGNSQEYILEIK